MSELSIKMKAEAELLLEKAQEVREDGDFDTYKTILQSIDMLLHIGKKISHI